MDQTLIVTYLPSGDSSRTKRLLNFFLDQLNGRYHMLDLLQHPPEFMTPERKQVFLKRNYEGRMLSDDEAALLAVSDTYIRALRNARNLVIAYPMHNFSMPAIVKAFFDAVIIKGETFDIENGEYVGLMNQHRCLALSTSGGIYDEHSPWYHYEHCFSLQKCLFQFMGYEDLEIVPVQGCDEHTEEEMESGFQAAFSQLKTIAERWK